MSKINGYHFSRLSNELHAAMATQNTAKVREALAVARNARDEGIITIDQYAELFIDAQECITP